MQVAERWRSVVGTARPSATGSGVGVQDRDARLELLRYHLSELKALDLKAGRDRRN